jgi:hypothetical protein
MNASHNMTTPGFGFQLVYNDTDYPEFVVPCAKAVPG